MDDARSATRASLEDTDPEVEADYEGEFHRWRCPRCEDVQECEADPRGNRVECGQCGWDGRVAS